MIPCNSCRGDCPPQVVILQRQLDVTAARGEGGNRPASDPSERTRQRMRRDRAVVALGLDDAMQLPHGVLAELVQVRSQGGMSAIGPGDYAL